MREDERRVMEAQEIDDIVLEALAEAQATPAPPRLRERVLVAARAGRGRPAIASPARMRWRVVGSIAAGCALVLGGLLARARYELAEQAARLAALEIARTELLAAVGERDVTLAGMREALAAQARALQVLSGPRARLAALAPKDGFQGSGRVLVDADTGDAAIALAGLAALDPGKTYQLWTIRGDRPPEPAGLLGTGTEPTALRSLARLSAPGEIAAFAISIEPAGGSERPTGPIVMVGTIG